MAFASGDDLEQWALEELRGMGFAYLYGSELLPENEAPALTASARCCFLGGLTEVCGG